MDATNAHSPWQDVGRMQARQGLGRSMGSRGAATIHFQVVVTIPDHENSIAPLSSDLFFFLFKIFSWVFNFIARPFKNFYMENLKHT